MQSLKSWFHGVKFKMFILALVPMLAMVAYAVVTFVRMESLANGQIRANGNRVPKVVALGHIDAATNGIQRWIGAAYMDEDRRPEMTERLKNEVVRFEKSLADYETLDDQHTGVQHTAMIEEAWKASKPVLEETVKALDRGGEQDLALVKTNRTHALREKFAIINKAILELEKIGSAHMEKAIAESQAAQAQSKILVAVGLSIFLTVFVVSLFFAASLSRGLTQITSSINETGVKVSSASQQLSATSQQASSSATEAAASLEETVASIEELSSMVKLNADHAREAATLSQGSRSSAEEGEVEIKQLITAMDEISKSSKKIEDIIGVIDDIAFQTNILALNAAVEAARAGEQGRGFAVVAEAVRDLAQRSSGAAKEIAELIKDSSLRVESGGTIAGRSNAVFKNIVTSVKKIAELNDEISNASQEQAAGLQQISQAMNQIDQATQSNAASAEHTAASSEDLSRQASNLKSLVSDLSNVIDGTEAGQAVTVKRAVRSVSAAEVRENPRAAAPASETSEKTSPKVSSLLSFKEKKSQLRRVGASPKAVSRKDADAVFPMGDEDSLGKTGSD